MNEMEIRRVLVALRARPQGLPAAAVHARWLAERLGADLILMSVIYDSTVAARLRRDARRAEAARRGMLDAERTALERIARSLRDGGVSVRTEVRWHQPIYEAVLQAAEDERANLLVVDVLDPYPVPHTRFHDTDWQLMRLCPRPILYVNDPDLASYDTVLAAVDPLHPGAGTEATDRAVLALAAAFARAFGSRLRVVHAYPDPARYAWVSAVQVAPGVFYGTENVDAVHRRAVEEVAADFGVEPQDIDVRAGDPSEVIEEVARERRAKLIVLGALQRSGLELALLGTTAEAVVAEAGCDVVLVRGAPPPDA